MQLGMMIFYVVAEKDNIFIVSLNLFPIKLSNVKILMTSCLICLHNKEATYETIHNYNDDLIF